MFRQTKRRTAGRRNFETKAIFQSAHLDSLYSNRLSFYDIPPLEEITLEQFEIWAIDRLKVLIEIESCLARSKSMREIETTIKPLLGKYLPLSPLSNDHKNSGLVNEERKKDYYSHFILRLVFCRTEELRSKFIKNEVILFKIRYNLLQPKEQQHFIELYNNKLNWNYITNEEKLQIFDQLYNSTGNIIKNQLTMENGGGGNGSGTNVFVNNDQLKQHVKVKENFIKLPFEKIPNLVSSRSIYISKGYGYIPTTLQLNLLAVEFLDNLSQQLLHTFQSIPKLEEDDRLLPLLNNLSRNFSNIEYQADFSNNGANSDINAQSIMTPAMTKHYPMCASHLQKSATVNSHLRYAGRQQLGLFLKGIGLNVDEALKFWGYQFTKPPSSISLESFNKNYKYNIRHNYGLEGSRTNYKPWDCATILSKPKPSKGEYHGCPYRDLNLDALTRNLNDMGIKEQGDINEIVDDVNNNNYTVACTRVFDMTHKAKSKDYTSLHINHPNLYFDRSRQLERSEAKA